MAPVAQVHQRLVQLQQWTKRSSDDGSDKLTNRTFKVIYILLLVFWVVVIAIALFLAYRKYKRIARSRGFEIDPFEFPNPQTPKKRLLTESEISTLKVSALTVEDIISSKRLATHHIPSPKIVHSKSNDDINTLSNTRISKTILDDTTNLTKPTPAACKQPEQHQTPNNTIGIVQKPRRSNSQPAMSRSLSRTISLLAMRSFRKRMTISQLHEENCAVCLEDFVAGEQVRQLPCQHYFHIVCIDPWLMKRAATCPLCNFDVGATFETKEEVP